MKIEQKPEFQPITITLETEEEAKAVWDASGNWNPPHAEGRIARETMNKISNWFSNRAQMLNG